MARIQRLGNQGSEVQDLQQKLNTFLIPSPGLTVDGAFGPNTEAAVKAYQRERGLAVDGVVGSRTWTVLNSEVLDTPLMKGGETGATVKRLQSLLNASLSNEIAIVIDGVFGPATRKAVMQYQAAADLGIDGVVGPETWDSLLGRRSGVTKIDSTRSPSEDEGQCPWMKVARRERGQSEVRGENGHNARIIAYHATTTLRAKTDEVPWCSSFVNWVLKEAGVEGTNSAAAASWLDWGESTPPRTGAVVVIHNSHVSRSFSTSGNHVGFLVRQTSTHFEILGGNQRNQVRVSKYPRNAWRLKGYRWPKGAV